MDMVAKEFVRFGMLIAWVTLGVLPFCILFGIAVSRMVGARGQLDEGADSNRLLTAKLVLLQYYLFEMTNAMRIRRGGQPHEYPRPVALDLSGHSWELLRSKVRQVIQLTMGRLSWAEPS